MPTKEKAPQAQPNPNQEAPLSLAGRVSRQFREVRDDLRAIRETRREARADATPEDLRRRRMLGAAAGVVLVAGAYLTMKYDFPAMPALANMRNTQRSKDDRIGTAKVLRDTIGQMAVRTRAKMARPALEHGRAGNRRRLAALTASVVMAGNLQPASPAAEKLDHSPAPAVASTTHTGRQLGVVAVPSTTEAQPVHTWRVAQNGDGANKWAVEMIEDAGLEATPERVGRVSESIIDTNHAIDNDPQNWMNQGDAYDIAPAQDAVQDMTQHPPR